MNALANRQDQELTKFLCHGYPDGKGPVTFRLYTGQEDDEKRQQILADPPDILLTNYVMLELILTRVDERKLIQAAKGLRFLVLDELHTYRGRQGADVALLVRRTRDACEASQLQHVGTSATMATEGTFESQRQEVARVASLIFGAPVEPPDVIGETLRRATPEPDLAHSTFREALTRRLTDAASPPPAEYQAFIQDPLSRWIEGAFGLTSEAESGRLLRAAPRPIGGPEGGAVELSSLTGIPSDQCGRAVQEQLLAGYAIRQPDSPFPVFAFRLHQFISRGDTVYATVEVEAERYLTVYPRRYVPGDRGRLLFPLTFYRGCGQEYYTVRLIEEPTGSRMEGRAFDAKPIEATGTLGYLYLNTAEPWTLVPENLPDDWLEPGDNGRMKHHLREAIPRELAVGRIQREQAKTR